MTRARFVLGDEALRQRFEAIRQSVIAAARDCVELKAEIIAMRERLRAAHPLRVVRQEQQTGELFDIKHSPGGMIDAEFVMQYLVLAQSQQHPELMQNSGNIALLERAEVLGLLPAGVGHAAASAYREMRRLQHHARLNEEPSHVFLPVLLVQRDAVLTLWQTVFGMQ